MNVITSENELYKRIFDKHNTYCCQEFQQKYIPHSKLKDELLRYANSKVVTTTVLGQSFEGRDIFTLKAGNGKTKILLWSQMHGDESTATRALLDILCFLNSTNDEFDTERQTILSNLTLYFVPMLNPDGAQRWQRRTAQGVDMNRDALQNITPEGQLLQNLFNTIRPNYAFNLHDQASYYTAGQTTNPATISLLAPPIDMQATITTNRRQAMMVVCALNNILQNYIPNCVGKWNDDYEPRAFGEHFQTQGAATILIESGGRQADNERNFARKLNFTMLISAFHSIATGSIPSQDITAYLQIPENHKEGIFDILYKNITLEKNGCQYTCDIGVRRTESLNQNQ